jgi:hypothetical protein
LVVALGLDGRVQRTFFRRVDHQAADDARQFMP